jgi:hypothetical protein
MTNKQRCLVYLNAEPFVAAVSELHFHFKRARKVPLKLLNRAVRVCHAPSKFARVENNAALGTDVSLTFKGSNSLLKLVAAFRALD